VSPEYLAEKVQPIIAEFFKRHKARLFSKRQQQIFTRINATSKARSDAGKKGGRPRNALNDKHNGKSPAEANEKHLELEPKPYLKERSARARNASSPSKLEDAHGYRWDRNSSFGENQTRAWVVQWAKTRTKPVGLIWGLASGHLRELVRLEFITELERAWLLAQQPSEASA
jgi:hypothetical protein